MDNLASKSPRPCTHESGDCAEKDSCASTGQADQSDISANSASEDDAFSSLDDTDSNNNNQRQRADNVVFKDDTDVLDHYRFILLVRSQLGQTSPFQTGARESAELRFKNFDRVFNNLRYHYKEMMALMDGLSKEATAITEIYKDNI